MSKSTVSVQHTRVQKVCTLWTHDESFSKDDVVFNGEKFPELPATPGSLIQIVGINQATAVRDFQSNATVKDGPQSNTDSHSRDAATETQSRRARRGSFMITLDENGSPIQGGRDVDPEKSYIFVVKPLPADLKTRYPQLQVSISEKIAKVFGFRNRIQVVVTPADEERYSASHVEVTFRDEYLARADMWRMSIAELSNRTVYRGQKLLFMGTIKATIKNVYINGQSKHSGYFSSTTKPVFRSESARYVLFIQMSKEMWDFDAEGAGEIMFNKVVNGFLPDLFKRWMRINARHLVTIILFTRMQYIDPVKRDQSKENEMNRNLGERTRRHEDFYRVVVSDMASGDWINILYQLKKEFRAFLRDVSLVPDSGSTNEKSPAGLGDELKISGKPSAASYGNILEAINLAAAQFAKDYIDRDLVRTGISVVVITAGTGVYEVDYNMLKLTTDTLVGSGIGIDLVCLSPMPLHSVPLFKYRNPRLVSSTTLKAIQPRGRQGSINLPEDIDERTPRQTQPYFGSLSRAAAPLEAPPVLSDETTSISLSTDDEWRYAMPHWVDISFWSGPSDEIIELSKPRKSRKTANKVSNKGTAFALRCRMYELQMMGVMETELGDISIPYMEEDPFYPHRLRDHLEDVDRDPRTIAANKSAKTQPDDADTLHEQSKALHQSWMDVYDENIFTPVSGRRAAIMLTNVSNADRPGKDEASLQLPKDSVFSSSIRSIAPSFGRTARPPPDANFHQLMRERSKGVESQSPRGSSFRTLDTAGPGMPRADVLYRQNSTKRMKDPFRPTLHGRGDSGGSGEHRRSRYSTPNESPAVSRGNTPPKNAGPHQFPSFQSTPLVKNETSNRPSGWFLRQISFGGRFGGPAKSITGAGTGDVARVNVEPVKFTAENNQKGAIAAKLASTKLAGSSTSSIAEEQLSEDGRAGIASMPINIRISSRGGESTADSPSSDRASQSVETVRGTQASRHKIATVSHPNSVTRDPGSTFLLAGSRALADSIGPKLDIASSSGARNIPRTLSPTSAIAPWAVLVNPCNPRKNNVNVANQFRRWQHVFPKRLRTSSVKWKSLCSPAAVPLTNDYFPTEEQLKTEYNESPYKISQNEDDEMMEAPRSRESLIRELIAFRLSHGFQIIVGNTVADFSGTRAQGMSHIFHTDYMSHDGDTVFMCVGNTIHQLVCVAGGEVEVKRFSRKPTTALQSSAGIDTPFPYRPHIRTALEDHYHLRDVVLRPPRNEYNWNFIDTFLAGYHDEFTEILRFWRARFVLIPVELPTLNRRPLPPLTEDSEEEIRLEGIRKLTQVWQRNRYVPPEERSFQATSAKKLKDPNPLSIEYHTRDPSVIVAAGPDSALLTDVESEFATSLFSETEQYHTSSYDVKKLAEDLQGEKGIPMIDRRWHWRLHYNCFIGSDLTSWLQMNFKDIGSRDDAVIFGNDLMNEGLFLHVQKRHQFRDGNFFYQIAPEYGASRPESRSGSSWFSIRRTDKSVPSTPLSEGPRSSPLTGRSIKSRQNTSDSSSVSEDEKEGEKTPTRAGSPKRKVTLSRVMRYDVDSRKRSYRPELINLHYDRLHNPDNCYHIRIDWMNVTAKLIEDAIVTWATNVEKYGLKLVEVPIAEASNIIDHHPFRSPYFIKLAVQPPQAQPEQVWDTAHFSPQPKVDQFAYHKELLRKFNFVLDMEAASAFPADVDVEYSWGKPEYKYTQFIHRSGTLLVQITNEGAFLLLANRLAHNRAKDNSRIRPTDPYEHKRTTTTANTPVVERATPQFKSPFSSPLARPVQDSSLLHTALQEKPAATPIPISTQTPEQIKDEIEAFCSDAHALRAFYKDALKQAPSPSPRITPVLDSHIPNLGLPPSITPMINVREASPANVSGWSGLGSSMIGTPGVGGVAGRRTGSEGSGRQGSVESTKIPVRQDSQGSTGSGV
ncbi:hypothetical protein BDV96DRAFT_483562 [Lophiotrema nucula]|uniref:Vacuolar membrane-associated protein IML1 n=1 Tax=Lophiotrema nucula TaxID=690887 RepID=A0A6A5ZQJ0_9PLEO|nr:hypothetical protein BDV96DRAFT_483562 [Lophiotrema nucula]